MFICINGILGGKKFECRIKYAVSVQQSRMITFESSSYNFSQNDSFYDVFPTAAGNSYGYGGNSRRYENTVAWDGCSARVERSLSWSARLPQENVNICFHGEKRKKRCAHGFTRSYCRTLRTRKQNGSSILCIVLNYYRSHISLFLYKMQKSHLIL